MSSVLEEEGGGAGAVAVLVGVVRFGPPWRLAPPADEGSVDAEPEASADAAAVTAGDSTFVREADTRTSPVAGSC